MGSQSAPGCYDEQSLQVESTLHEICDELAKSHSEDGCENETLRAAIAQRLLKLVEKGITDPFELRRAALRYFDGQSYV